MDRTETGRVKIPTASTVWLATPDGLALIDVVAVERVLRGEDTAAILTRDEARYAACLLRDQGVRNIASRLGLSSEVFHQLVRDVPKRRRVAECGTREGYRAHRRRSEQPCDRCRTAQREADAHYRRHGTYVVSGVAA